MSKVFSNIKVIVRLYSELNKRKSIIDYDFVKEIIEILPEEDFYARVNNNFTIMQLLIMNDKPELVEILLNRGYNIKDNGNAGHLLYSSIRNIKLLKLLIKYGINVNTNAPYDKTLLFLLLSVDQHTRMSGTIKEEMIELLINAGANINTVDQNGNTVLIHNILHRKKYKLTLRHLRLMLKYDVNLDIQNDEGQTALTIASFYNLSKLIRILIKNNANPNNMNAYGQIAIDILKRHKNPDYHIINYIKEQNYYH